MAIVNFCGFETNEECFALGGGAAVSNAIAPRSGDYFLALAGGTDSASLRAFDANGVQGAGTGQTTTVTCAFFPTTLAGAGNSRLLIGFRAADNSLNAGLYWNDDTGVLTLQDANGSVVLTAGTVLAEVEWAEIGLTIESTATGAFSLEVNRINQGSGTSDFLTTGNTDHVLLGVAAGSSTACYYDDVVIRNDSTKTYARVRRMDVTGAGNYTSWVAGTGGGAAAEIDDYATIGSGFQHDSDASYVTTSTQNNKESAALTDSATLGITSRDIILAVKGHVVVRDENQANTWRMGMRTNSTDVYLGSLDNGSASYFHRFQLSETAFDGGGWTTAKLDATEPIVDKTQSQARPLRLTAMCAYVLYIPVPVGKLHSQLQAVNRASTF